MAVVVWRSDAAATVTMLMIVSARRQVTVYRLIGSLMPSGTSGL
jgi:hypothetical protein